MLSPTFVGLTNSFFSSSSTQKKPKSILAVYDTRDPRVIETTFLPHPLHTQIPRRREAWPEGGAASRGRDGHGSWCAHARRRCASRCRSRSLEERGALALAGCAPAGVGPMRSLSPDGQPRCAHTHLRGRSHALVLAVEAGGWPCSPEGRSTAALAGGKRQRSRFRTTRGGNNRMGAEGGFRCPTGSAFLALWGLK